MLIVSVIDRALRSRPLLAAFAALLMAALTVTVSAAAHQPRELRGLAFAPFRDCQSPDMKIFPDAQALREDIDLIAQRADILRTYSALNGMADAVVYARSKGLRVSAGAWLGSEKTAEGRAANRDEIASLVAVAQRVDLDSVIVGNEVLLRGDLTPSELAHYIREVKEQVKVPVTTAEIASIAIDPRNREVIDEIDYLLAHIYPYWDGIGIDGAAWYVADTFRTTVAAAGKRVVIGETGWPSAGPRNGAAEPNVANAERFLREWMAVAHQERIDYYYFAANDEPWKQEGGVGAYWGILDADRHPKHAVTSLLGDAGQPPSRTSLHRGAVNGGTSSRQSTSDDQSDTYPIYRDWPGPVNGYVPSAHMGDASAVTMDTCSVRDRHNGRSAIAVDYTTQPAQQRWAGVAWQVPSAAGRDFTGYRTLTFWARGSKGGERITFFGGGAAATTEEIKVRLTPDWQEYKISLIGLDLRSVITAFGWAASLADNPDGVAFHLDDIQLDHSAPPRRICADPKPEDPAGTLYVVDGATVCSRNSPVSQYDIGLDSGPGKNYVKLSTSDDEQSLRLEYQPVPDTPQPGWGTLFVTVGPPVPTNRPGQDLSRCHTLQADLRAATGNGRLRVGMKDATMPDDGRERKVLLEPTDQWQTYSVRLSTFRGLNVRRVYVPIELVFEAGDAAQTVLLANVRLLCGAGAPPTESGTPVYRPCVDIPAGQRVVVAGSRLCPGFSLGVAASSGADTWLSNTGDALRMAYPAGQVWGAVFIVVGNIGPGVVRKSTDLSRCGTLRVDLHSLTDSTTLSVGMKDIDDPDDGGETKVLVTATRTWSTRSFPISGFGTLNRRATYVVIEFIFSGASASTVEFRNVRLDCP
jgi:exo-beta-1,3-glucanase (GH17 family)